MTAVWRHPAQLLRTPFPGRAPQLVLARVAAGTRAMEQEVANATARASITVTVVRTYLSPARVT